MKQILLIATFNLLLTTLSSQVRGTILDIRSKNPIINVNVTANKIGTSSDSLGQFFIDVRENQDIMFSHSSSYYVF